MRTVLFAAAIAFAFAISASAQATNPQPTPPEQKTTKTQKMSSSGKAVTLTGCLREGDTPNSFQLDNVQMSGATSEKATKEHGTTGTPPGMASSEMGIVRLVGAGNVNLKEHVGHTVQVTGLMTGRGMAKEKPSSPTSDTMGPTGTSGTPKPEEHTLNVRSLKHVSETCTK